jgi:ankyrin repeat protein
MKEVQREFVLACQSGDLDRATRALAKGATVEPEFVGVPSPLMFAAESGNLDLVLLVLAQGANVHYRDDMGSSALECAALVGDIPTSELLLQRGAADIPNAAGARPSDYAEHHGHVELASLIRQRSGSA